MVINADDTNEAQRFHVGSTIAGRYRVERPIGEGAMGAVALARHMSLDEAVAIKFLRPELRRDPVAIGRLSREAKALARIKSEHVARVLDVGATLSVGPYMVMEYLEGTDLGTLLEREGPLPVARAVEHALQLCEALTVAHTAGIVHRDIKPQNLFLARHGQFETLKVLDFGICSGSLPESGSASEGALYGTPSYMSPERLRNDPSADHRADIWSVGVVLHELVTGWAVFDGGALADVCARIVSDAPIALESNGAVLPQCLRAIIARCLERDVARRYQSAEELTAALAPLATMHERFRGRTTGAFSMRPRPVEPANGVSFAPVVASAEPLAARARSNSLSSRMWRRLLASTRPGSLVLGVASVAVVASLTRGATWAGPPASGQAPHLAAPVVSASGSTPASRAPAPGAAGRVPAPEPELTSGDALEAPEVSATASAIARPPRGTHQRTGRGPVTRSSTRAESRRAERAPWAESTARAARSAARAPRARARRSREDTVGDSRSTSSSPRSSVVRRAPGGRARAVPKRAPR